MSTPDTPVIAPSGGQLHLRAPGGPELVAVTLGGGLREGPGLDGYGEGELCSGGRGQVLAPWPNRLAGGRWSHGGRDLQLALSEPPKPGYDGAAIHGLVRWAEWHPAVHTADTAVLEHVLGPQPGYPWRLLLVAAYTALADGFTTTLSATNLSATPAPFGIGQHPYLSVGTAYVDEAELTVGGHAGVIGAAVLDDVHGNLARDADGRAHAVLRGPDRTVTLWADEAWKWFQVFTGDTLAPGRRRRGVAVEPMTCPADALATGRDLVTLEPGETWSAQWGLTLS